tara:strand:- start:474 stop:686 length:213 start_codon:yes stop_codon:yes gene_type:complete
MRKEMLQALVDHAKGQISKHKQNVEIYLTNPAGIGEHSDIIETVEKEVMKIAEFHDQLEVLEKYFGAEIE